ncbi:FliH/SctL family protein [Caldanaerobius polysaccharolyticus]|uniref:FliH/SctL family protein n=1 Tax=Caldanaerobius polysaccharolyticus TaxID=44256 RepID=UPI00047CDE9C|nr:FliH/SctL family protein [Caldanaerobius polysaccharolyticus]
MSKVIKATVVDYEGIYYIAPPNANKDKVPSRADERLNEIDEALSRARAEHDRIIKDALVQRDKIIEEAGKLASEQKEQAKQQGYMEGKQKGYADGYAEGMAKGLEEGRKEAQAIVDQANRLKEQITQERQRLLQEMESDMVRLLSTCVEKILGEINKGELYQRVIHEAMSHLSVKGDFEVRVCDDDYKILSDSAELQGFKLIADPTLKQGDIIIDTPDGSIDCGIMTQLDNMKRELRSILLNE